MKDLKSGLKRLERLSQIRETVVSVAEAGVKQAEAEVRKLAAADSEVAGNIQDTRAGIAYIQTASGSDLQNGERYIRALEMRRVLIQQSLEIAAGNLEKRQYEWPKPCAAGRSSRRSRNGDCISSSAPAMRPTRRRRMMRRSDAAPGRKKRG